MSEQEIHYFDDWDSINAVFAGNLARNLKAAEKKLSVRLIARDTWVKIVPEDRENLKRASEFISEITKIHRTAPDSMDQKKFDEALHACSEGKSNELQLFFSERIKVSPRKRDVSARNPAQLAYIRQIRQKDIVFGIGPAGTGKTYLAMAMAVSELLAGKYNRIILTRPAVEAGENLGFQPGNLEEKIMPYLRPLYDAIYEMLIFEEAGELMEKNVIEVAPLAFMRGRTLNNSFIILDEAQNTTPEQMLMFLTRMGFNSKCIITGDPSQVDLPDKRNSGLAHAEKVLKNIPEIAFTRFSSKDVVRHALVEKVVNAYMKAREKKPKSSVSDNDADSMTSETESRRK